MIISKKKKIVILLNPKCGCSNIFESLYSDPNTHFSRLHGHFNIDDFLKFNEIEKIIDAEEFLKFNFYVFYRDPLARFLSAKWYIIREVGKNQGFDKVTEWYKDFDMGESHFKNIYVQHRNQIRWLTHPEAKIHLLDFKNFGKEISKLFDLLGSNAKISASHNTSKDFYKIFQPTKQEIETIKKMYAVDYEFFASKGISFV